MKRTLEQLQELVPILQDECKKVTTLSIDLVEDDDTGPYIRFICKRIMHTDRTRPSEAQISYLKDLSDYHSNNNIWKANKWAASMAIEVIIRHKIEREQLYFVC